MINCVAQVPAYVLTARLFDKANQMVDYPWAYLVGATVVKKDAWEKIPADCGPGSLAITKDINGRIDAEVKRLNDDAVAAMKKQGLDVVKVDTGPVGEGGHALLARRARQGRARGVLRPGA